MIGLRRYQPRFAIVAAISVSGIVAFLAPPAAVAAQLQPMHARCSRRRRRNASSARHRVARRRSAASRAECIYAAEKDAKRIVRLALGEFPSKDEASNAYTRARANAQFDGLKVENVRGVGQRAHWLPQTNNFERTVLGEQVAFGELTVLEGRRVYSVFIAPPSRSKARDAIKARHPGLTP
jgi:hypothetical protein